MMPDPFTLLVIALVVVIAYAAVVTVLPGEQPGEARILGILRRLRGALPGHPPMAPAVADAAPPVGGSSPDAPASPIAAAPPPAVAPAQDSAAPSSGVGTFPTSGFAPSSEEEKQEPAAATAQPEEFAPMATAPSLPQLPADVFFRLMVEICSGQHDATLDPVLGAQHNAYKSAYGPSGAFWNPGEVMEAGRAAQIPASMPPAFTWAGRASRGEGSVVNGAWRWAPSMMGPFAAYAR